MVHITISNDPATLGPEATDDDVQAFAGELAEYMANDLGFAVRVTPDLVLESRVERGDTPKQTAAAEEALSRISDSSEWVAIAEAAGC